MREGPDPGDCAIALDIGGTGMKGALLDRSLRPLQTVRRATPGVPARARWWTRSPPRCARSPSRPPDSD